MFEKPTINDFLGQLQMQHDEAVSKFSREKLAIESKASAAGANRSSRTILLTLETTETAVRMGVEAMLGELKRAIRTTELDRRELRDLTVRRLDELTAAIVSAGAWEKTASWLKSEGVQRMIEGRLKGLKGKVNFWVRQFDVGFDEHAEPEPASQVTNILNARDISGAVQQGHGSLTQSANIRIEIATASKAIEGLEAELSKVEVPAEERHEIECDLATIKAQLQKPRPSAAILREAGRTVRNIAEGVIAGALTPQGVAAAVLLAGTLGI